MCRELTKRGIFHLGRLKGIKNRLSTIYYLELNLLMFQHTQYTTNEYQLSVHDQHVERENGETKKDEKTGISLSKIILEI
jgi:hypothetical protein